MSTIKEYFLSHRKQLGIAVSIIVVFLLAFLSFYYFKQPVASPVVVTKNKPLPVPLLSERYGFTLTEGIPSLVCYPNNPLDISSGKEAYIACDSRVPGSYVAVLWRSKAADISGVQGGSVTGLLKSQGAEVTLLSRDVSSKDSSCFRDKNFVDTVTGMSGYFINCSVKNKNNSDAVTLYISFFHFTAWEPSDYAATLLFSNIGSSVRLSQEEFMNSVYSKISYLQKTQEPKKPATSFFPFFEKVYAGGGGGGEGGGGGGETGTSCCVTDGSGQNVTDGSGNPVSYGGGTFSGGGGGGSPYYPPVPTVPPVAPSLSGSPTNLTWNTPTTLTWSSSGASSCTASGAWSGGLGTGGSQASSPLTSASTFNLYCSNAAGNSPTVSTSVTVCPESTPTWDGSVCRTPTGTLTSSSCTIPLGSGSCAMNVKWDTQYPSGVPEVRRPYASNSVLASGISGNGSYTFPYQTVPYTLDLYDRTVKLSSANFVAHCVIGGFDTTSGTCVNPIVDSVIVTGQYYSTPGNIALTCLNSDSYKVLKDGTLFKSGSYTGTVNVPVTDSANYAIICTKGSYDSTPTVKYYNSPPPPPPVISIVASPRTIAKNVESTLSWSVQFPIPTCALTAKVVCAGTCTQAQINDQTALNQKILTETTDASDPYGSRSIVSAVKTMIPTHINTDWKGFGKKTFKISNTTDFTIACGAVKSTARIRVTQSNEQ